jgi:hypothetical protein
MGQGYLRGNTYKIDEPEELEGYPPYPSFGKGQECKHEWENMFKDAPTLYATTPFCKKCGLIPQPQEPKWKEGYKTFGDISKAQQTIKGLEDKLYSTAMELEKWKSAARKLAKFSIRLLPDGKMQDISEKALADIAGIPVEELFPKFTEELMDDIGDNT